MNRLSVIITCYQQSASTENMLNSVMKQDMNGWDVYFVGDNCPELQKLIDNGVFDKPMSDAKSNGNKLSAFNMPFHYGGDGYQSRNTVIRLLSSEYTILLKNTDIISENHFSNYFDLIKSSEGSFYIIEQDKDRLFVEFPLVIKTSVLKKAPQQSKEDIGWKNLIPELVNMSKENNI